MSIITYNMQYMWYKRKTTTIYGGLYAHPARFERAAFRLGGECSILLSYGCVLLLSRSLNGRLKPLERASFSLSR